MPTLKTKPKGKLQVRLTVNDHFVEYYHMGQWKPAAGFVNVRDIAHTLGYNGIKIEPQ